MFCTFELQAFQNWQEKIDRLEDVGMYGVSPTAESRIWVSITHCEEVKLKLYKGVIFTPV